MVWIDRLLPVVPDLVNLGLYALRSFQRGVSIMLSHPMLAQTRFKLVNEWT